MTKMKQLKASPSKAHVRNPFKGYQDSVVSGREQIITRYLASLRKTRANFEFITDLAKAVAEQVEMAEGAPCSFTTLLRNKRYKALLLNFMAMRSGTDGVQVTEPAALTRIHTAELELGNLKRDNERLRNYILELESRPQSVVLPAADADGTAGSDKLVQLSNEKALVCKALWLVLNHFKELVSIDSGRGCIIDLAASKRSNVIVDAESAKVFLDWVRSSGNIGK